MDNIYLHILTPNKYQKRFFGVDFFMNILTGSNPLFKYYSTTLDANPVYKSGPVNYMDEILDFLESELSTKPRGSIIGIQNNPDIYKGLKSLSNILDLLVKYEMGLYLETTSQNILNDIEILKAFSKKQPLLVAIPCATTKINSKLIGKELKADNAMKIISKLTNAEIKTGVLIKPIIPSVNDNLEDFMSLIERAIAASVDFIYPSLSLKFDSKKIRAFYDIIDIEFPEKMVKFQEEFGYKTTWESKMLPDLKKNFVIECKKNKVLYAMKDVINLYKPDLNIQLKLF
jgi:DNA repair photolyase